MLRLGLGLKAILLIGFACLCAQAGAAATSTIFWNNASGGTWNTPGNWNPPQVPGPTDVAVINLPGTYTVTLDIDTTVQSLCVGGPSGLQTFAVTSHAFTLNSGSIVDVNGVLTLSGTAPLPSLTINTGVEALVVSGQLNWMAGTISGTGLTVKGVLNIQPQAGATLVFDNATLINYGAIVWSGDTPDGDMSWTNFASLQNYGLFDITGNALWSNPDNTSISNFGVFRKSAGTGISEIGAIPFSNNGTLEVDAGTLYFDSQSSFTNLVSGTLAHGNYVVKSILQIQGASINTVGNATLTLDGAAARIQDETTADALASFTNLNSNASLTLQNGAAISTNSTFSAAGPVLITGPTTTFTVTATNDYTADGITTLHNGGQITTTTPGSISINTGGAIVGDGTLNGDVGSTGLLAPGAAPATIGAITITGAYTDGGLVGTISIKATGATAGQFDQVIVGSGTVIDGNLSVTAVGGYKPSPADVFSPVSSAASISGTFTNTYFAGAACVGYAQADTGNAIQLTFSSTISDIWLGGVSNVWGNGSNWSMGVPGPLSNVSIPAAATTLPVLDTTYAVNDLLIAAAAGTRLDLSSFNLTVNGNLQTAGAIASSSGGILVLAGTNTTVESLGANGALPSASASGFVSIASGSMTTTFNGGVDVPGQLTINGSQTAINGNFSTSSTGVLVMNELGDSLTITGNAAFNGGAEFSAGTGVYNLSNGMLSIGGMLSAGTNSYEFVAAAPHTTVFTGASSAVNLPTGQNDAFGNLAVGTAAAPANLQFQSDAMVSGNATIVKGAATSATTLLTATIGGSLFDAAGGNWQAANTTFTGNPQLPAALQSNVTFTGYAILTQGFTILGDNDLIVAPNGVLDIGGNLVTVGGDFQTSASFPYGLLYMFNQAGELSALGDVYFGGEGEQGLILAGRIRVKGDFQSGITSNFYAECVNVVTFDGSAPQMVNLDQPMTEPFQNLEVNGAAASVTFATNATISGSMNVLNGAVTIPAGIQLSVAQGYLQTSGSTQLAAMTASISAASPLGVQLAGGTLSGIGTIQGDLLNSGVVAPGLAGSGNEGTLTVAGNYTQTPGGALNVRIKALGTFDALASFSGANLGGALNVTLDGYAGNLNDTFNVVQGSESLSGTFATLTGSSINATLCFTTSYTALQAQLVVEQKPLITSALTATGQVGMAFTPYTITASGTPVITLASGPLPAGLTFDGSSMITGTPAPGSEGVANVALSATNAVGVDNETLVLTINRTPAFTSPATAAGVINQPFSFTLSAVGFPAPVFAAASALPPGLTLTGNVISGTPTAIGLTPVMLTATNPLGSDAQTLSITISASGPPVVISVTSDVNPQMTGLNVTFTALAMQPDNAPLTYTWDFMDGTATVMGNPVQHAFAAQGTFNVTVTVSDGLISVPGSVMQQTLAPSSSGSGVGNIGQSDPPISNPLNGITIAVTQSNGGVLTFSIDIDALIRDAFTVNTDFLDIGGRSAPAAGLTIVHQFLNSGVSVATSSAMDTTTNTLAGKARKTVAISDAEVGAPPKFKNPPKSPKINVTSLKGNFAFGTGSTAPATALSTTETFAAAAKPDTVTMAGSIELPEGLDITQPQTFSFGIGNIIDQVTVNSKGKGLTPSSLGRVKALQIHYPHLAKGAKLTTANQIAKFTISISQAGLSASGFDTEGISATLKAGESRKKPVSRSIQVAFAFAGGTWEVQAPVTFTLSANGTNGGMGGR